MCDYFAQARQRVGGMYSNRLTEKQITALTYKMYAIVEIKGQQFKAEAGKYLYVHHLGPDVKEGDEVSFDKVLLIDADGNITVGVPTVEGAKVSGKVLEPLVKGDKVIVFKKKRRKGYRRKNGHRQQFSKVMINEIVTA